jgi:NADH-quinone oxidoreductase subunit E
MSTPEQPTALAPLSDKIHEIADRLVRRYPVARSALLPLLHLVQSEQNFVSAEGIAFCADKLGLTKAEVGAVATFYTMYKREPVGDYLLSVCCNPTCQLAGGQVILDRYKATLGGTSDPATKVTIEEAECLGICDAAPVVQVNYEMYGPLTDGEADKLLAGCRAGTPPDSNVSKEAPPTFSEVSFELAGGNDDFDAHLIAAAHHAITAYKEVPAYKSGETDIPVTHPGGDPMGQGGAIVAAQQLGQSSGSGA